MHKLSIPQSIIERVVPRRRREHVYDDLHPSRTALVVVDMQNAFMLPGVASSVPWWKRSFINRLAAAVRRREGAVVWIKTTSRRASPN